MEHRSGSYAVAGYTLGLALCLLTYTAYIMQVSYHMISAITIVQYSAIRPP